MQKHESSLQNVGILGGGIWLNVTELGDRVVGCGGARRSGYRGWEQDGYSQQGLSCYAHETCNVRATCGHLCLDQLI